jgi:adenosylcobinamide kinase/adenosylcobinamide-phosphate guanylyltransferase
LIVVDCLTLWLTARLMPADPHPDLLPQAGEGAGADSITTALRRCAGPVVLISNEIGQGVIPMGRDTRNFVDALGTLNQQAAAACERVTLMSAGLPMLLKGCA